MLVVGSPPFCASAQEPGERFHIDLMCVVAQRTPDNTAKVADEFVPLQDGLDLQWSADAGKMLADLAKKWPKYVYSSSGSADVDCTENQNCTLTIPSRPGDPYAVTTSESLRIVRTGPTSVTVYTKGSLSFVCPNTAILMPTSWDGYQPNAQIGKTYCGSIYHLPDGTRIFCLSRISLESMGG